MPVPNYLAICEMPGSSSEDLADAILAYSASHHRDTRNIRTRLAKIVSDFGERSADKIKPEEIDAWLTAHTSTPATSNQYRALFSLVYREALRNGKVNLNPARLVRQRHENNIVIRWLPLASFKDRKVALHG